MFHRFKNVLKAQRIIAQGFNPGSIREQYGCVLKGRWKQTETSSVPSGHNSFYTAKPRVETLGFIPSDLQPVLKILTLLWASLIPSFCLADTSLPRVLLLGDFIYNEPARNLQKELKGKVEIHYPKYDPGFVLNTTSALENFDKLIGEEKWDLIHFNVGLGDLIYRAPGMQAFRVFPQSAGGVRTTTPEQYEKNLHELVKRLKATGSKLVWASTTPIRSSSTDVFMLGSEIEYNAIAARVMNEQGIPSNDMYTFAKSVLNMDKPAAHGVDPFFFDRQPIHPPILRVIEQELGLILATAEGSK